MLDIGSAEASDVGGIATISNNAPNSFGPGIHEVTWTASDPTGNTSTYVQRVEIIAYIEPENTASVEDETPNTEGQDSRQSEVVINKEPESLASEDRQGSNNAVEDTVDTSVTVEPENNEAPNTEVQNDNQPVENSPHQHDEHAVHHQRRSWFGSLDWLGLLVITGFLGLKRRFV
ncbi:MAG: hypothetical protein OEZ43_21610 [Gammaproteobacteria bacterium]|nr:hypothetical protein [Gammaproteobacteria bacterium]